MGGFYRLEVITGCMFSGKSGELRKRVLSLYEGDRTIKIFKSVLDNRYTSQPFIQTHDGMRLPCELVRNADEIMRRLARSDKEVVAIEEAQFLDYKIIEACEHLADTGHLVIVAGLNEDFRGLPFPFSDRGNMGELIAAADRVDTLTAQCKSWYRSGRQCDGPATKTQKLIRGKPASYFSATVKVGGKETYVARCRRHHEVPDRPA